MSEIDREQYELMHGIKPTAPEYYYDRLAEELGCTPTFYNTYYTSPLGDDGIHWCVGASNEKDVEWYSKVLLAASTIWKPEDFTINSVELTKESEMPNELIEWLKKQ